VSLDYGILRRTTKMSREPDLWLLFLLVPCIHLTLPDTTLSSSVFVEEQNFPCLFLLDEITKLTATTVIMFYILGNVSITSGSPAYAFTIILVGHLRHLSVWRSRVVSSLISNDWWHSMHVSAVHIIVHASA